MRLERERYQQPVVVQSWVDAPVLAAPPASAADWRCLLDLFCATHQICPASTPIELPEATLNAASAAAGRALIDAHLTLIPPEHYPDGLEPLLERLSRWDAPTWPAPPRGLCRVDINWRNFLRGPQGWVAVDWENAGWGDPAFEWAELATHPAYAAVRAPWAELLPAYAARMGDPTAPQRAAAYTTIMRAWWAVRWARYLYEVPHGLDARLVERPAGWLDDARRKYARAVDAAMARLDASECYRPSLGEETIISLG